MRNSLEEYTSALQDYVSGKGETSLEYAYKFGRKSIETRRGLIEIISNYKTAIENLLSHTMSVEESKNIAKASIDFLKETLAPFEMTHRGFQEANITLRKLNDDLKHQTEKIEAMNKELESFSYSVSHDLRAPLRGIDGFSQILLEDYADKVDVQGKDYLQQVRSLTMRMAQLIDDLLKLSRITRAEIRKEEVNLSELTGIIADELKRTRPDRNIDFIIASGLLVNGDRNLIRIALENLISNAFKFTGNQSKARIELGRTIKDQQEIYFVRDNGAGFNMAYVNKLFGAFQRLHTTDEFPGTGIGLATVQRIIHRHGGSIWAEGQVNKGATFYFTLNIS